MRGSITGRDVVLHAFTIIRLWGVRTYVRCLRATLSRRPTTFLAVVHGCMAEARPLDGTVPGPAALRL